MIEVTAGENKGFLKIEDNKLKIEIDLKSNNTVFVMAWLEAAKGEYIKTMTKAINEKRVNAMIRATIQNNNNIKK